MFERTFYKYYVILRWKNNLWFISWFLNKNLEYISCILTVKTNNIIRNSLYFVRILTQTWEIEQKDQNWQI